MRRSTMLRVYALAAVVLFATWRGALSEGPPPRDVTLTQELVRSLEYLSLYLDEFSRRSILEGRIDEGVTAIVERIRLFDDPAAGAIGHRVLTALDRVVRAPGFDGILDNGASVEILAADALGRIAVSGEATGRISVWDVAEGVRIAHLPDMEKPAELSVSTDGQYAFGASSGEIHVWDIAAVRRTAVIAASRATRSDWTRFVGGGRRILLKRGDATTLHDVETGREVARLAGTAADPARFTNDAAVVTHSGQRAMLWNAIDGRRIAEVDVGDKVMVAAMSGRLLLVGTVAGKVSVFEVPSGRRLRVIDVRPRPLAVGSKAGRFAPPAPYDIFVDGRGLRMVSGDDGAARLWDLTTGNPIADLWVNSRPAASVTWTPQATFLANDTRVLLHGGGAFPSALWNAETGEYMLTYVFSGRMADNLRAVGPGRGSFVTDEENGGLLFVEAGSGRRYARIPDDDPLWTTVVPAGPDTLLCYRRIDGQIRRFRLPPADVSSEIAGLPAPDLEAATALPDGRLVVGDNDGVVHLFHPRSGAPTAHTMVSPGAEKIKALSSSSDGSRVVAVAGDAIVLLNTDELRPLAEFGGPGRKKDASVTFSPDGRRVAVYHPYGAMLWDATDGRTIAELAKPGERGSRRPSPDALESAAFDPVGSRLAVVRSQRNATEVLDALSGTVVTRVPTRSIASPLWIDGGRRLVLATAKAVFAIDLAGETSIAWASEPGLYTELAASPDGDMLAGTAEDGALVLWEASTGKRVGTVDLSHLSPNSPSVRALWFVGGPDRILARMNSMNLDEPDSLLLLDVSAFPARVLATEPLPAHIDPLPIGTNRLAFPDEEIRIIDTRSGHLVSQLAPGPGPRIPLTAQKAVLVVAGGVARRVALNTTENIVSAARRRIAEVSLARRRALGLEEPPAELDRVPPAPTPAPPKATDWCAVLAGHPEDPATLGAGVPWKKLDAATATEACAAAVAAAPDDGGSWFRLGRAHQRAGHSEEAVRAWLRGAKAGSSAARTALAASYQRGEGVTRDYREAARLLRQAADQSDPRAMQELAAAYRDGLGVAADAERALVLLHAAAAAGLPRAFVAIAEELEKRDEGKADTDELALRYYRAVWQIDGAAAYALGRRLASANDPAARGEGIAALWRAADLDEPRALVLLGDLHARGEGMPADLAAAARLYEAAGNAGVASAFTKRYRLANPRMDALSQAERLAEALYWGGVAQELDSSNAVALKNEMTLLVSAARAGGIGDTERILADSRTFAANWRREHR